MKFRLYFRKDGYWSMESFYSWAEEERKRRFSGLIF